MKDILENPATGLDLSSDHGELHPLVAAARSMRPVLEGRLHATDEIRRLPQDTVSELRRKGLLGVYTPSRFGGSEANLATFFDIVQELGQADGAVGWAYTVLACGSWMVGTFFSEHAAQQVYESENPLTAAVMAPTQIAAEQIEGGILIREAQWTFNSGIQHAGWDVVGIPIFGPDGAPIDMVSGLVRTADLTIIDDWRSVGLRGSGSCTVVAKDLFIPDEMLVSHHDLLRDEFPIERASASPLYNMAVVQTVMVMMSSPAIAIARGALTHFLDNATRRGIAMTFYREQSAAAVTHLQVAEAEAKIDAAEAITRRSIAALESAAAAGRQLSVEQRARIWRDAGFASRLSWEAVDLLASASGGSFVRESGLINHAWRDVRAAISHAGLNTSTVFEIFGRIRCGLPSNSPLLPA